MDILSNTYLDEICLSIIDKASTAILKQHYYLFLYNTGCRPSEPLTPSTFIARNINQTIIQPLKNNNLRYIDNYLIPPSIYSEENGNMSYLYSKDYDTLLTTFNRLRPVGITMTNIKGSSLYLFRYNYVRKLSDLGLTPTEITTKMGWKNPNLVHSYLNKSIFTN